MRSLHTPDRLANTHHHLGGAGPGSPSRMSQAAGSLSSGQASFGAACQSPTRPGPPAPPGPRSGSNEPPSSLSPGPPLHMEDGVPCLFLAEDHEGSGSESESGV